MSDEKHDILPPGNTVSAFPARSRVLVVDDEPLILEGLARLLEGREYDVTTAGGGCDALIAVGKQQFDVVLLDLGMPDLSGTEVLRFIADRSADTSVIVVSGDSSIDAAIRALRGGATDFVRKPYEPEELLRRIDNTLVRRRLERRTTTSCSACSSRKSGTAFSSTARPTSSTPSTAKAASPSSTTASKACSATAARICSASTTA
jgi:DNA-binding response OmpR family regulator